MRVSHSHAISAMPPKKKHSMQPAATGLDKVLARSIRKAAADEAPLLAWPLACGSAVAARTRALDFADGILRVEVPDAGWRRELQALAARYLATLSRYGADGVTGVEFVVSGRKHAVSVKSPKSSHSKRA